MIIAVPISILATSRLAVTSFSHKVSVVRINSSSNLLIRFFFTLTSISLFDRQNVDKTGNVEYFHDLRFDIPDRHFSVLAKTLLGKQQYS